MNTERILEVAERLSEQVIAWRRDLHQMPELGVDLPKTSAYVMKQLDEMGVEYESGVGLEHAIVAVIKGKEEGKTVALRADMDALPVKETTGLDFQFAGDRMHACGHDAHTAQLLGAVKAIKELEGEFKGTVKFLFQPAEEISAGAEPMVKAGVLKNPDVDYIIGLHDGNISPDMEPGRFAISTGAMMACLDRFTLKVIGKGSHGAYPHQSHDTLVIASLIVVGIQEIIAREIDPVEPGVITLGKFHAGSTYNVIPGEAEIEGTLRAVTQETRDYLTKRIGEVAEGIAKTYKATVEYDYLGGAPPVINDHEVATRVHDSIAKVLGEDRVDYMERPVMGGEDFAYYLEQVPGCFIFMSNPLPIDGTVYPHHNPKFALNEANFKDALAAFLQITFDLLEA